MISFLAIVMKNERDQERSEDSEGNKGQVKGKRKRGAGLEGDAPSFINAYS